VNKRPGRIFSDARAMISEPIFVTLERQLRDAGSMRQSEFALPLPHLSVLLFFGA